ncbi:ABC transporter permease, partial [Salmonella enterica subsp. enterica serovar Typhimurium]
MLRSAQLKGILPAIPTPVNADDTIHTEATRALLRYLLGQGIDGVVPLGGTGEYGALSRAERIRMAEITVREVRDHGRDVPVIAGVLDPGYHDAIEAGRDFAAAGADGLLVLTPYYTNPTQAGIRDYFVRYA